MATDAQEAEIQRFESYIKADPKNALIWTNLGDLYHQTGRFEEAIASYEKCLMLDESNLVARGRLANVLITQHRFAEAEEIIRGIIKLSGEDGILLHNLGITLFYQERFADAQAAFQRARDAGQRAPRTLAYLVYSLHKQNQTTEAKRLAETWLKESPGPSTEGYISMLEFDHGDTDAARARAERVIAEQTENPDANVVLGAWSLERQDSAGALNHYGRVVKSEPTNPRGWQGIGLAHMHRGEFSKALEALQKAEQSMPRNATNHLLIGWARLSNKDLKGAEQAFRKAIAANRSFAEAHGGLATSLVFQNRLDEAKNEIKTAIRLDSTGFGAIFAESVLLHLKGKEQRATKLLGTLLEQAPMPRSKPIIEYIQEYMRSQGHASTWVQPGDKFDS